MPTKHQRVSIPLTVEEKARLEQEAERANLSAANLIRRKLKLPVLIAGAPKGNRNAAKSD